MQVNPVAQKQAHGSLWRLLYTWEHRPHMVFPPLPPSSLLQISPELCLDPSHKHISRAHALQSPGTPLPLGCATFSNLFFQSSSERRKETKITVCDLKGDPLSFKCGYKQLKLQSPQWASIRKAMRHGGVPGRQSCNAHLRIRTKRLQMFCLLDCLISSTFHCIGPLNSRLSHCSLSRDGVKQHTCYRCWVPSICFYTVHDSKHLFFSTFLGCQAADVSAFSFPFFRYLFHLKPKKPNGGKTPHELFKLWEVKRNTLPPMEKVTSPNAKFCDVTIKE